MTPHAPCWRWLRGLGMVGVGCALVAFGGLTQAADLMSAARVHPPFHGVVPARSDVIFSSRFTKPEAIPVIKAYGATRVEWVYTADATFAAELQKAAPWFGGALNANPKLPDDAGYVRDFDGGMLHAPWMTGWGVNWVSSSHPAVRAEMERQLRVYMAMGARSLQFDDPQMQVFAVQRQGGDFNDSAQAGFVSWLARHPDRARVRAAGLDRLDGSYRDWLVKNQGVRDVEDYKRRIAEFPSTPLWLDYQRAAVLEHHAWLRASAAAIRGRAVPLSMNLGGLTVPLESKPGYFLARLADYSMAETSIVDVQAQLASTLTARALGMGFAPSLMPRSRPENRVAIAYLYALGGTPLVPWDVFVGAEGGKAAYRFYGAPEDYADLYAFVRRQPALFDGLESTPMVGIVLPVDKADEKVVREIGQRLLSRQIPFAYVPVGGQAALQTDADRLRPLRLLVTTQGDADYPPEALRALAASGVPRVTGAALRDEQLDALRPFQVAPGAEAMRIVPRADPGQPDRLVVHWVDGARGELTAADPGCRRRMGLRRELLGPGSIGSASWRDSAGGERVSVDSGEGPFVYFSVDGCALWGVLDIRMKR